MKTKVFVSLILGLWSCNASTLTTDLDSERFIGKFGLYQSDADEQLLDVSNSVKRARFERQNGLCVYEKLSENDEIIYPGMTNCEYRCGRHPRCYAYEKEQNECILHFNKGAHGSQDSEDKGHVCFVKTSRGSPVRRRSRRAFNGLSISVHSAGIRAGNFARIRVNGKLRRVNRNIRGGTRGINMVVINPQTKKIILEKAFDTFESSEPLEAAIESIPYGSIVAAGVQDEGSRKMSWKVRRFFQDMGAWEITQLKFRQSYAFIGVAGMTNQGAENRGQQENKQARVSKSYSRQQLGTFNMNIKVTSAGIRAGNMCSINVAGRNIQVEKSIKSGGTRGINLVVLNPRNGNVFLARAYDTLQTSDNLEAALDTVPYGYIIAAGIQDEGSRSLSTKVKQFFKGIGSKEVNNIQYRQSWAIIGTKGGNDVAEQRGRQVTAKANAQKTFKGDLLKGHSGFSVTMLSAGIRAGNFALMFTNGQKYDQRRRGISMFVLDANNGKIIQKGVYDTFERSNNMENAIKNVPNGSIVVAGIQDEGTRRLSNTVKKFFSDMGSSQINRLKYRQGWAFIGVKGKRDFEETANPVNDVSEATKAFGAQAPPQLIGCFKDGAKRDLNQKLSSRSSPQDCFKMARQQGYKFAGLQYKQECWAGNRYGSLGQVQDRECSMDCNLDKNYKCGAGYRNNVYSMELGVTSAPKGFSPNIKIESAGMAGGNVAKFWLDGKRIPFRSGRGLNIIVLDNITGKVLSKGAYDTYGRGDGRMIRDFKRIPKDAAILVAVKDEGSRKLSGTGRNLFKAMGSREIARLKYRHGWAFVGQKSNPKAMKEQRVGQRKRAHVRGIINFGP